MPNIQLAMKVWTSHAPHNEMSHTGVHVRVVTSSDLCHCNLRLIGAEWMQSPSRCRSSMMDEIIQHMWHKIKRRQQNTSRVCDYLTPATCRPKLRLPLRHVSHFDKIYQPVPTMGCGFASHQFIPQLLILWWNIGRDVGYELYVPRSKEDLNL